MKIVPSYSSAWPSAENFAEVALAPILVIHTFDKIRELKVRYRLTVLMAEQNFHQAIRIADRGYVIVHGRIEYEGASRDELSNNELVRKLYMGM